MSRRHATSALVVLLATLLIAPPVTAQLPTATSAVEILDPGVEPRRELRYDWALDHQERLRTTVTVDIAASEAGRSVVDMKLPVSMTLDARVTEVNANGTAWVAMTFDELAFGPISASGGGLSEADTAAGAFDQATALVAPMLAGTRVWHLIAGNGRVVTTNVQFPDGFPVEARQQIMQSTGSVALLPLEPVGVGARWQTAGTTETQGMSLSVTTTMELVAMDGDDITLAMSVRASDAGAGVSSTRNAFEELTVEGGGTYRLDLGGVFPRDATASMTLTTAGGVPDGSGGSVPVEMHMVVDMDMRSRDRG